MPGYPVALAPLFLAAGGEPPVLWARWQNAVFGVLAVGLVMAAAGRLFDGRAACFAGLAAAVYPGAIATSTFVLSEGPFCPLIIAHLLLWMIAAAAPAKGRQVLLGAVAGIVAGLATLTRASWLLFTPFALCPGLVGAGLSSRADFRNHVRVGGGMLCGLVLAMAPWWIRNARVTGVFVPTTLQVGESLYDGLHPGATGASDMRFVKRFRRELKVEDRRLASGRPPAASFEQRLDRRMRDAAIEWAAEYPGQALRLAAVKFLRIWNVWPNEPSFRRPLFRLVVAAGYLPLLVLGIGGALMFSRRGWPYVLCWLPALYVTCLHVVFVGSIRYRQPVMLPVIVLAAGCFVRLQDRLLSGAGSQSSGARDS
jgi:4-amino-4-deoxy-L-arabinose transferase-like glycosyltransferase